MNYYENWRSVLENEDFISSSNIDIHEIWECILEEIEKTSISAMSFDIWIKTLKIVDIRENTIILTTPTTSLARIVPLALTVKLTLSITSKNN